MDKEMLLEKFIQSRLSEVEQKEFDRLYIADESFKAEVDFHANISRVAEAEDDDAFREMLSGFEKEALLEAEGILNDNSPPVLEMENIAEKTSVKRLPNKWLVAASIALIAGITYFLLPDSPTSPQELFTQNFEPYPNVVHPIVRGEEGPEPKTKAFLAYQNREYASASILLGELYLESEEPDYLFYQANALLQLNRAREAIPLLQNHLETNDSLTEKTSWYLAMAYLQVGDSENAMKTLHTVVVKGVFKVEEAKKLMQSLQKLATE